MHRFIRGGPPPEQLAGGSNFFSGGGHVLGSEDIPSRFIPDPSSVGPENAEEEMETAVREITFWRTGFTIQDGPLMEYDDPTNREILQSINSGCVHLTADTRFLKPF